MGLGGWYCFVKCSVVIVNFLFWIAGLIAVALAVWMLIDPSFYVSMAQDTNNYFISTYIILAIGALLIIVAFLGCCGSFRESQCMLISFFSILLIVLVAQIAAAVWAYVNADSLEPLVRTTVKTTVMNEYAQIESRRTTFDTIQQKLECCGAENPTDWTSVHSLSVSVSGEPLYYRIPVSCCREGVSEERCTDATRAQVGGALDYDVIHRQGCVDKLVTAIRSHGGVVVVVLGVVMAVELVGLVFALVLVFAIGRNGRYKA